MNYEKSCSPRLISPSPRYYSRGGVSRYLNGTSMNSLHCASSTGTSPDLHGHNGSPDFIDYSAILNSILDGNADFGSDASLSPPLINVNNLNAFSDSDNSDMGDFMGGSHFRHNNNNNNRDNDNNNKNSYGLGQMTRQSYDQRVSAFAHHQQQQQQQSRSKSPVPPANRHWNYCSRGSSPPRIASPSEIFMDNIWGSLRISEPATAVSNSVSSAFGTTSNEYMSAGRSPLCEKHRETVSHFCDTCSQMICSCCIYERHASHQFKFLCEAIEQNTQRCTEIATTCLETKNYLLAREDNLNATITALDKQRENARKAVTSHVKLIVDMIQAQERELLTRIEEAHKAKTESLKSQCVSLKGYSSRLHCTAASLAQVVKSVSNSTNPMTLVQKQDVALAQLYQIRQTVLSYVEKPGDCWIVFNPSDNAQLLKQLMNIGTIGTKSPGAVGEHRDGRALYNDMLEHIRLRAPLVPSGKGEVVPGSRNSVHAVLPDETNISSPILELGTTSDETDNFCRPWGVACDPEGHIIVADRSNNRIMIYSSAGQLIRQFGSHGSGAGQFDRPAGIVVDARKRVVVVDKDNHRVQVLTMEGTHLFMFGQKGSMCGQFNYPWDVAVNSECQILVTDTRNHRIQQFSANGTFLRKFGFESTPVAWKTFDSPRGVAFDPNGEVVITDFNTHRVIRIDSEFAGFNYLCDKNGPLVFSRPQGLLVDDEGNYIVADSKNCQVLVFKSNGDFRGQIGMTGHHQAGELDRPSGMALTPNGRLVVVDFGHNRVVVF
ncbi:E3 ubiquitin-protein ligase TRIM71-like [Copidosoma floridanum]|uniref:E3 ubiquitin-protein ligase TRIM71-like n=1 Tax=Copidosoma floridanum TaxID=29053 RepID=UPI0006C9AF78|nr:E3 ubiquitin-protein ligase TRIM71-like [Copidosoma floridanum]